MRKRKQPITDRFWSCSKHSQHVFYQFQKFPGYALKFLNLIKHCCSCFEHYLKRTLYGAIYMGGGTGRLPRRDVKRDLVMQEFSQGVFRSVPEKRHNFYYINTPSRFAGTILCWIWKLSRVKSSRVETFSCKPGVKASRPGKHPVPLLI